MAKIQTARITKRDVSRLRVKKTLAITTMMPAVEATKTRPSVFQARRGVNEYKPARAKSSIQTAANSEAEARYSGNGMLVMIGRRLTKYGEKRRAYAETAAPMRARKSSGRSRAANERSRRRMSSCILT